MSLKKEIQMTNGTFIDLAKIPLLSTDDFNAKVISILKGNINAHCAQYFAIANGLNLQLIMLIARDDQHDFIIFSHQIESKDIVIPSLTKHIEALHIFEREIHENFKIQFVDHPWLKPVRYAHNRADQTRQISNYPFYKIDSSELHEVSVGPIHAGIIEPGHFKFSCHGETVKHLEIQLGWQHRGVEHLMIEHKTLLQKNILAESITADTTIGHSLCFVNIFESLAQIKNSPNLRIERTIALELERIAMHTGDLCGMCTDIAYQLGSSVFNALRTPIINFMLRWTGSRFGKGLIRVAGTHYSLSNALVKDLFDVLEDFEWRFKEIGDKSFSIPSVLKRFDGIGAISKTNVKLIGGVGLVAKSVGIQRDLRGSHPLEYYKNLNFEPQLCYSGDVMARAQIRYHEVLQSVQLIRNLIKAHQVDNEQETPLYKINLKPDMFCISAIEGWRGEIVHTAITDDKGYLKHYKIKDPSMHNWKALELSLRNVEISDFPINNKSYDLSYSGHDL
jgi:Ni,Fe-hydrogenase III large subunit